MAKAIPNPDIQTIELAGSAKPIDLSIIGMFLHADIIVQAVMLLLLASSFWCWAIIFDKLFMFRVLKKKTLQFERSFWSGELLEALYDKIKNTADHPMAKVFVSAMYEWRTRIEKNIQHADSNLKVGLKERVVQGMSIARNREIGKMEKNLGFLATTGSTAPFVGLFGTVWGIMDSFQSIALTKNTTLAVVAPGIAEALLATAIGLFAAIPAVIFYNKFTNDLGSFSGRLDDFSEELGALISREVDGS